MPKCRVGYVQIRIMEYDMGVSSKRGFGKEFITTKISNESIASGGVK